MTTDAYIANRSRRTGAGLRERQPGRAGAFRLGVRGVGLPSHFLGDADVSFQLAYLCCRLHFKK